MNWLNRLIRGMAFRDGALSAYSLELGALLILIGVASLLIGLLVLKEVKKQEVSFSESVSASVI
jgi:ABC-2 type transport system permease protein